MDHLMAKILIAIGLFGFCQMLLYWSKMAEMGDNKMTLEAEVESLLRKKENLQRNIVDLERDKHRMELKLERIDMQVRDLLPMTKNRKNLPPIFFVTPTARRPTQKADLTRLHETLVRVPNLVWIVVEDAEEPSEFIDDILAETKMNAAHLTALTPEKVRMNETDPHWKLPRGVNQRNTALNWIRTNYRNQPKGVVYFGDDDNTYHWKLFEEMRTIHKIGVWPVGIVGGLLVETPLLHPNLTIKGFNSAWKPSRPFPIDMAAFAVNITLVLKNAEAQFSVDVQRGYQESHFLGSLGLHRSDLEPKANFCSKVYVWHTRTAKAELHTKEKEKFRSNKLSDIEREAVA